MFHLYSNTKQISFNNASIMIRSPYNALLKVCRKNSFHMQVKYIYVFLSKVPLYCNISYNVTFHISQFSIENIAFHFKYSGMQYFIMNLLEVEKKTDRPITPKGIVWEILSLAFLKINRSALFHWYNNCFQSFLNTTEICIPFLCHIVKTNKIKYFCYLWELV